MSLLPIHNGLATVAIIVNLLISAYSFWRTFRYGSIDKILLGLLIGAEVIFLAQVVIGGILLAAGVTPSGGAVHILYGVVLIATLPVTFVLTRGGKTRRELVIYAVLGLFLAGVSIRAIATGRF